ncbi:basic salivary proline-rich protein 2-like [Sorex fumeus]|uniref:basic salivary proline-rich protein 2-like n=1 Tax=Sorex fumeus TaxID=62283 RepID=UPI0024ADB78F|nr:basic salivary proline-rich protein 2-like [Sorex fumeus]
MLGRGAALRDTPRVSLTRPLPGVRLLGGGDRSRPSQPRDSPRVVRTHTCTSPKDVWAIPPPLRRPWRRTAPGPSLRSRSKDKRAAGPPQPAAGISTSHDPKQSKSKRPSRGPERPDRRGVAGGAGQPEGAQRPSAVVLAPVGSASPCRAPLAVERQPRPRAGQPRGSRRRVAASLQTPDGKGGSDPGGHLGGRSPSSRLGQTPPLSPSLVLLQVQELFSGSDSVPRGRGGSLPRRRAAAARLPALHLTRRPRSRAGRAPFQPLPRGGPCSGRGAGLRSRGLRGLPRAPPGKCLNNRTDAAAPDSPCCGKVRCCGDWSCPLGRPSAQLSRTKRRPAALEPAGEPRTPPFLLSTPAVPGTLGSSRLRPGAAALPSLAAAFLFFFSPPKPRLRQPPPPPPPPPAAAVRARPE